MLTMSLFYLLLIFHTAFLSVSVKKNENVSRADETLQLNNKLFETTRNSTYFLWGKRLFEWTKTNLQDSTDNLYFDNVSLSGKISRAKYSYNSGQMLQAAVLLHKITGNKAYLTEAQNIAQSSIHYFTEIFTTPQNKTIKLKYNL